LARAISDDIDIVGPRPGEKLDEDLISEKELEFSKVLEGGEYIMIGNQKNRDIDTRLEQPVASNTVEDMSPEELKCMVEAVRKDLSDTLLFEEQY